MTMFRFVGRYTGDRDSITCHGVTFEGNEPAEVTDKEAIRRLSGNQDFEAVDGRTKAAKSASKKPAAEEKSGE